MSPQSDAPPLIAVVDDDTGVRDSLSALLAGEGWRVLAFESAEALLASRAVDRAACLLVDVRLPGMDGLALNEHLQERGLAVPLLVITGHGDVPMAVEAMKNGARDFIEKPFTGERIATAVREALAQDGHETFPPPEPVIRQRLSTLTTREREVMRHLINGGTNKAIARRLGISHRTVEIHRANLMRKLKARNLPQLVRLAVGDGGRPRA
ncbi:MAG: response regulator [Azospirillaceae bacterium]